MRRTFLIVATALLSATSVDAARLTVTRGDALVSHGDGYESVRGGADLSPGDTVVARAGSAAKVTFANGCTVHLGMGIVFSVPAEAPCAASTASATPSNVSDGVSETSAAPTQDWASVTQTTVAPETSQFNVMPYLLGVAAIGGISAAALALNGGGGGGSPPASP